MATIVEMINPLTGLPEQVDKLDHTAQEIDDAVDLAPQLSNPNLLDNWYFGNPVNQRGQTSYTGAGYGIDRWRQQADGTVLINQDGLQFNGSSYVSTYLDFDALSYLRGKQVTLSVLYKNALSGKTVATDWYGNEQKNVLLTSGSEGLAQATFTIPSDATEFRYIIGANTPEQTKEWYTIQAVKLELGSQQTLAHQENGVWVLNEIPDFGEQLRRCQRYFWRSWTGERNTQNSILGLVFGNNRRITGFDYPVEMRTKPSITVYGLTGAGKVTEWSSDADYGPASPAHWGTQRCVALACDGAGLSNDNRVYYFIEANAEL